jgi:hypothetical protein
MPGESARSSTYIAADDERRQPCERDAQRRRDRDRLRTHRIAGTPRASERLPRPRGTVGARVRRSGWADRLSRAVSYRPALVERRIAFIDVRQCRRRT